MRVHYSCFVAGKLRSSCWCFKPDQPMMAAGVSSVDILGTAAGDASGLQGWYTAGALMDCQSVRCSSM
jgi:hypothetical protein